MRPLVGSGRGRSGNDRRQVQLLCAATAAAAWRLPQRAGNPRRIPICSCQSRAGLPVGGGGGATYVTLIRSRCSRWANGGHAGDRPPRQPTSRTVLARSPASPASGLNRSVLDGRPTMNRWWECEALTLNRVRSSTHFASWPPSACCEPVHPQAHMAGSGRCAPTSTCGERGEKRGESGVSPYPLAAPALPPCSTHSVGSPTSSTAANAAAVGQPAAADPPSSKSAAVCAPAGCGEPRRRRRQTCLWRWRRWRRRWSWQQGRLRCWWWASKGRGGRRGCVREGGRDSGFSGGYGVGGGSNWGRGGGEGCVRGGDGAQRGRWRRWRRRPRQQLQHNFKACVFIEFLPTGHAQSTAPPLSPAEPSPYPAATITTTPPSAAIISGRSCGAFGPQ